MRLSTRRLPHLVRRARYRPLRRLSAAAPFRPRHSATMSESASAAPAPAAAPAPPPQLHRLAPLNPAAAADSLYPRLAGIIFDVDGTLCRTLDIPAGVDILEHVEALPAGAQPEAHAALQAVERRAMDEQRPRPGLAELMDYLAARQVPKALCTRNFDQPVMHLLETFLPKHADGFSPVITRAFRPPKPHPAGLLEIARQWNLEDGCARVVMVGDSIDDMAAARRAGCALSVLVRHADNGALVEHPYTDISVAGLGELMQLLEEGLGAGAATESKGAK